jgi:hypothetical protein
MEKLKKQRGGTRQGSGAKPKYNEPTKTISFRVPISKIEVIKKMVTAELQTMTKVIDFTV